MGDIVSHFLLYPLCNNPKLVSYINSLGTNRLASAAGYAAVRISYGIVKTLTIPAHHYTLDRADIHTSGTSAAF